MEIILLSIIVLWLIFCGLAGGIASDKGRSFFGPFLLSIFLTPLIGIIVACCMSKDQLKLDIKKGDVKKCSKCAEMIKKEAIICRFCGETFKNNKGDCGKKEPGPRCYGF